MWVRKTPEDFAKERKHYWLSFGFPLCITLLLFICSIIRDMGGIYKAGTIYYKSISSVNELVSRAGSFGLVFGISVYLLRGIFGPKFDQFTSSDLKTMICNNCFLTKSSDGVLSCECGGAFEDFSLWKWEDD